MSDFRNLYTNCLLCFPSPFIFFWGGEGEGEGEGEKKGAKNGLMGYFLYMYNIYIPLFEVINKVILELNNHIFYKIVHVYKVINRYIYIYITSVLSDKQGNPLIK